MAWGDADATALLVDRGLSRGALVGLVIGPGGAGALVSREGQTLWQGEAAAEVVSGLERAVRPRWVWWSNDTASALVASDVRVATCWDVAAVHRLLHGGWRADPARAWSSAHGLTAEGAPSDRPPDLFSHAYLDEGDPEDPVQPDGYLRPEWLRGGWASTPARRARWAALAVQLAQRQQAMLRDLAEHPHAAATARSESTAELLCAELSRDGLPMDRTAAEAILTEIIGPRPASEREALEQRSRRDAEVLAHIPSGIEIDLRSPSQVKALLGRLGVDVPDTRAARLRAALDVHPVVGPLLAWRKAERVASTYGYGWLDEHLGPDGRLRGAWTGCDGAAGRMTASAGLHNMPADFRPAVVAERGHVFVRADLGQIEPRVLAAVSRDRSLAAASNADDMYAPVAEQLGVDRATAKAAVLGAMYGQTTGHGANALRGLLATYPVAMAYLDAADRAGQAARDLRTYGGRRILMGSLATSSSERESATRAGARGRYGRNAMIQGAAAELFKMWAVTVRARAERYDARILLCLHDELLVHAPVGQGEAVATLLVDCLEEASRRWAPEEAVRFVADVSVIARWSDAKDSRTSIG